MSKYNRKLKTLNKTPNNKKPNKRKWFIYLPTILGASFAAGFIPYWLLTQDSKDDSNSLKVNEAYIRNNKILDFEDNTNRVIPNYKSYFKDATADEDLQIDVNMDMNKVYAGSVVTFTVSWGKNVELVNITITNRDLKIIAVSDTLIESNIKYKGVHTEGSVNHDQIPFMTNFNDGIDEIELQATLTNTSPNINSLKNDESIMVSIDVEGTYYLSKTTEFIVVSGLPPLEITLKQSDIEQFVTTDGASPEGIISFTDGYVATNYGRLYNKFSSNDTLVDLANGDVVMISMLVSDEPENFIMTDVEYTISGLKEKIFISDLNDYVERFYVDTSMNVQVEWKNTLPASFKVTYDSDLNHEVIGNGINFTINPEPGFAYEDGDIYLEVSNVIIDEVKDKINRVLREKYYEYLIRDNNINWNSIPDITEIIQFAFFELPLAGALVIPEGVIAIGDGAFMKTGFTGDLIIPDSVLVIETFAFSENNFTGSLTLGNSLETIGRGSFSENNFTGSLIIPDSVISIGNESFENNNFTGSLTIGDNVTGIGRASFLNNNFTGSLIIPDNVVYIYQLAFQNNNFTGSLTLGNSLEIIGSWVFDNNGFTGSLIFPDSVIDIDSFSFRNNNFTGSLTLGNKVEEIGTSVFFENNFTGSLTIPDSVISIGNDAFKEIGFTGSLTLGNSLETIGSSAFYNNGFTGSLIIPDSVISIGDESFQKNNFTGSLTIGNKVTKLDISDFDENNFTGSLTLGNSIETITGGSLGHVGLTGDLIIPDSVTTIDGISFTGTTIERIYMPTLLWNGGVAPSPTTTWTKRLGIPTFELP